MQTHNHRAPTEQIHTVTQKTFANEVLEARGQIVVEFMSYGCAYCRELEPVLVQVAEMGKSNSTFFRVNVAVERELADSYDVETTPTLLMFFNGEVVGRSEGPRPTISSILTAVTEPFRSIA